MGEFFEKIFSTWYGVTIFCVAVAIIWILLSALLYRCFFKRFYDIILSGLAIVILSPLLIFLIICGAINMKGNPFFVQRRPGKNGKIFKLIKFRTMTAEKDEAGNFLPDDKRLTRYGRILRSSSLDELPELFNIFIGQMSVVGPRPLLVEYLDYYTAEENLRHSVRGGLTGWAQVNGRNAVGWDQRLRYDVYYIRNISLWFDIKIIFMTVGKVLCRSGLSADSAQSETNFADERRLKQTAEVESDD